MNKTLVARANLALIKLDIGKPKEAEKLQEEVLKLRLKYEDSRSLDVLKDMSILALIKHELGMMEEAEKIYEEQLELHRSSKSEYTEAALNSMGNLANLKVSINKITDAERLLQREAYLRSHYYPKESNDLQTAIEALSIVRQFVVQN
jgi:tetratricopeptide (TPR) repeat protein